jgi:hypothetical protein
MNGIRTSLYHLDNQVWVWEATARTGFSATNDTTPFTRLYNVSGPKLAVGVHGKLKSFTSVD